MPERIVLECDTAGCGRVGEQWTLDRAGRTVAVILCDEHAAPLVRAASLGRAVAGRGVRRAPVRGLDRGRLLGMVVPADK